MAKKKVNVRKDYSYAAKKSPPKYAKASIPRKPFFLILRGPGLDPRGVIEENEIIKAYAAKKRLKVKFLAAKTVDEAVKTFKDALPWAGGAVFNPGELTDDSSGTLKRTLSKLLYPTETIEAGDSYEEALERLQAKFK